MDRFPPAPPQLSLFFSPRRFLLQFLLLRFPSMWPPLPAGLPVFCPLFASPPEVPGKFRRETRLSGKCPRWPPRSAERSLRPSESHHSPPPTPPPPLPVFP